jgi:hypothetical protein
MPGSASRLSWPTLRALARLQLFQVTRFAETSLLTRVPKLSPDHW